MNENEAKSHLLGNYVKSSTTIIYKGNGSSLYDTNECEYLDMYSGVCVMNLGHNPKGWNEMVAEESSKCVHTSNYFHNPNEIKLSNVLADLVKESIPNAQVFFCNSGTEANEGALKMAILQNERTSQNGNVLAFHGGFHGRSIGSLSTTSNPAYREPFKLLMSDNVFFWDFNKVDGLEAFIQDNNIRIVIAEVVQGEGGVIPMTPIFAATLNNLHKKVAFMLIIDEIQTGMLRCGTMFVHHQYGFHPDFVTIAKALGNGIPIGAVLTKHDTVVKPGQHGSTFGGNPFATGVANWVVDQMIKTDIETNVKIINTFLVNILQYIQTLVPEIIVEIRHRGLLIGVEFKKDYPVSTVIEKLKANKILCISAGGNTLRICPRLNCTTDEIEVLIEGLKNVLGLSRQHNKDKIVIWKISGDIDDESYLQLLTKLKVWSKTHNIAIVFGAGSAINAKLKERYIKIEYLKGQRKTCKETIEIIEDVVLEQQYRLLKLSEGVLDLDLEVIIRPVFSATNTLPEYGYVLEPEFADMREINDIWSKNKIALVSFLSIHNEQTYNSNADLCLSCLGRATNAHFIGYSVAHKNDINQLPTFHMDIARLNSQIAKSEESTFTDGFRMKVDQINSVFHHSSKHDSNYPKRAFIGTNDELPSLPNSFIKRNLMLRNTSTYHIGLIGSRGYIGSEIAKYVESNDQLVIHRFSLPDSPVVDETNTEVKQLSGWNEINTIDYIDVWISSCPNDILKTNLHSIDSSIPIIDVSSDFRHQPEWNYGMCYTTKSLHSHRISNPGCYSSAVIAGLYPLVKYTLPHKIQLKASITGISSYSGAGKNYLTKFPELHNTLIPYQPLHHSQQDEMEKYLNIPIKFVPIITDQFDRGILCSIIVESNTDFDIEQVKLMYEIEYKSNESNESNEFIQCLFDESITTESVARTTNIILSNMTLSEDKKTLHLQSVIDNLTVGGGYSTYLNLCRFLGINHDITTKAVQKQNTYLEYDKHIESIVFPLGFHSATTNVPFIAQEINKKKVLQFTCLRMDNLSKWTATYTQNPICGNPVKIGRERLKNKQPIKALWINNKISNVGVAHGINDAESICEEFSKEFYCDKANIIPLSTGIIGWQLPKTEMVQSVNHITRGDTTVAEMARAIMTTDSYPKAEVQHLSNGGSIVGVAKGAGMIEPNMATTIIIVMTDVDMNQSFLDDVLKRVVNKTFNCISIDADTSTSDCCILISSGLKASVQEDEFECELTKLCLVLARQIVWNGEGIQHVLEVNVRNSPNDAISKAIGKNIVNSPLIKTAINGNDPNVGRIIGAMGRNVEGIDWSVVDVNIGEHVIFKDGNVIQWNSDIETKISNYLKVCQIYAGSKKPNYPVHNRSVLIDIDLKQGCTELAIIGGDLSLDYVKINGDYRS